MSMDCQVETMIELVQEFPGDVRPKLCAELQAWCALVIEAVGSWDGELCYCDMPNPFVQATEATR